MRIKKQKKQKRWPFIILGIILLPIALIVILLIYISKQNAVPKDYWNEQIIGGEIEEKYSKLGTYTVLSKEYDAPEKEITEKGSETQRHFKVWYPEQEGTYPLVVMVNGTGVPYQKYEQLFEHLASWGFVVIGNDYTVSWDGKSASMALDFALETSEIAVMVDKDRIAVGGHSQGGGGTLNAITEYENSSLYSCAFALSPLSNTLGVSIGWCHNSGTDQAYTYDMSKVSVPILMFAGTGQWDAGNEENPNGICPLSELTINYNNLPTDIPAVIARRSGTEHGDMLWRSDPYVTAWLMYWLYDDTYAGKAFWGENAEMAGNEYWQDFLSK